MKDCLKIHEHSAVFLDTMSRHERHSNITVNAIVVQIFNDTPGSIINAVENQFLLCATQGPRLSDTKVLCRAWEEL